MEIVLPEIAITTPMIVTLIIGIFLGFFLGFAASWEYRSYKVRNTKIPELKVGFLLKSRKNKNLNKLAITYIALILFVINLILYWVLNIDIPIALQIVAIASAGTILGVNYFEPLAERLLKLPPTTKSNGN